MDVIPLSWVPLARECKLFIFERLLRKLMRLTEVFCKNTFNLLRIFFCYLGSDGSSMVLGNMFSKLSVSV